MGFLPASPYSDQYSDYPISSASGSMSGGLRRLGWIGIALLILVGLGFSLLLAAQPLYAAALVIAAGALFVFLRNFEQAVLGILLLRSVLDMYSAQSIPAVFAIGVDLLVFLYLGRQLIFRQRVHTDPFWWFLFGWVLVQSTWVVLLAADGLGGTQYMAYEAAREWTRLFSLSMVYLLVMQLRDRIPPDRLANLLFLSAAIPLGLAILQSLPIELPGFLQSNVSWTEYESDVVRINSTLGHYNSFATFSLLFLALSLWRIQMSRKPLGWILLASGLLYCLLLSKSLTGIMMLVVFCITYFVPKLRGKGLVGAIAVTIALSFLLSSDLAQSRLLELNQTPLLNPDLTISKAIALQAADVDLFRNSFNWRLVQWRNLLIDWQQHPLLGYGLASAEELSVFNTTPHNDYIRFLVEEGIVGFSLFLLFLMAQVVRLVQIMRQSLPKSPQRALSQAMFAFMISMLVGMLAGNVMVHTATFFYWWALMALLGWSWPTEFGGSVPSTAQSLNLSTADSEHFDWNYQRPVPIPIDDSFPYPAVPDFYPDNAPYGDIGGYNHFHSFSEDTDSEDRGPDNMRSETPIFRPERLVENDYYEGDHHPDVYHPTDMYPTDMYPTDMYPTDSYLGSAPFLQDDGTEEDVSRGRD